MNPTSPNTQAILLLTSDLSIPRTRRKVVALTPAKYRDFAIKMRDAGYQPSELLGEKRTEMLDLLDDQESRAQVEGLLERGLQLTQALENWRGRAIWVISRADEEYPQILKSKLKHDAPALLFGCGDLELAGKGGLGIVGSRRTDDEIESFTREQAQQAAEDGVTVISGGAKGVDLFAMESALHAGGNVVGVLADSLMSKVVDRSARDAIVDGNLLLICPFDPESRFQVWKAMDRNKMIYAFSNATLVVNADHKKGGTWDGAWKELTKYKSTPVYVRNKDTLALEALKEKGARPWPNTFESDLATWITQEPKENDQAPPLSGEQMGFNFDDEPHSTN